jgi:hypothetical protein
MTKRPCVCCACNPDGPAKFATLLEEAYAHAYWHAYGCPNLTYLGRPGETGTQLVVRYFDRKTFCRSEAWDLVDDGQHWHKSHTEHAWCWYTIYT